MYRREALQAALGASVTLVLPNGALAQKPSVFKFPKSSEERKQVYQHYYDTNPQAAEFVEAHVEATHQAGCFAEAVPRAYFLFGELWYAPSPFLQFQTEKFPGATHLRGNSVLAPYLFLLFLDEDYRKTGVKHRFHNPLPSGPKIEAAIFQRGEALARVLHQICSEHALRP